MKEKNILLQPSALPYGAIPFDKINQADFIPAIKEAIASSKENIEAICANPEPPTFDNTLYALTQGEKQLEYISEIDGNLYSLHSDDDFKAMSQEISLLMSQYSSWVYTLEPLFCRVEALFKALPCETERTNPALDEVTREQYRIIEETYKSFVRKGALLDEKAKKRIAEIDERLSILSLQFAQNALGATNAFTLNITDEKRLEGMPQLALDLAAADAKKAGKAGWLFTLQPSSLTPVLTYCKDREIRKTLQQANSKKALVGEFCNTDIINEILALRQERAHLLGYQNHAEYVLEERMAKTPEKVFDFLNNLYENTKPAAEKEIAELKAFAQKKDGLDPADFQAWDQGYYSNLLKQEKFNYDPEAFRPYLKAENVVQGLFKVANKLYGIEFEPISLPVYHELVKTFKVVDPTSTEDDKTIGILYLDMYPRETKQGGAWMSNFGVQSKDPKTGKRTVPLVVVSGNLTPSTPDKPSLLSLSDANTLFHEFGHALHGLLSDVVYSNLASPNVLWDFVELPSQLMENWLGEKETLDLFAVHYETGEKLPQELIDKWKASKTFMAANFGLRQLSLATLDMNYHTRKENDKIDILAFEENSNKPFRLLPKTGGAISPSFGHLFAGGYSAGYYSYKWAEVLDADAFEFFKEKGIFSKEASTKFRRLLSKGDTIDPAQLYIDFRGKEADPKALLRRDGLI